VHVSNTLPTSDFSSQTIGAPRHRHTQRPSAKIATEWTRSIVCLRSLKIEAMRARGRRQRRRFLPLDDLPYFEGPQAEETA
jgi:hypothetical protein